MLEGGKATDTLRCLTEAEKETGTEGANAVLGFEVEGKGVGCCWRLHVRGRVGNGEWIREREGRRGRRHGERVELDGRGDENMLWLDKGGIA
jgi:hypothetical protein